MSRSAVYQGIGQGLLSFGQGLQQQIAESAAERRRRSLLEMQRQFQVEDRQENREFQMQLMEQADQRWEQRYDRQREDALADRDHVGPMDQARMGLLDAQTEAMRTRAERGGTDVADPSRYRELELLEDRLIRRGRSPEEASEKAMRLVYPQRTDAERQMMMRERAGLMGDIRKMLSDEFAADEVFERYEIPPGTPRTEAARMIFDQEWQAVERSVFGEQGGGGLLDAPEERDASPGSRNNPISVDSLTGPEDLVEGRFYLVNGVMQQWTGEAFR